MHPQPSKKGIYFFFLSVGTYYIDNPNTKIKVIALEQQQDWKALQTQDWEAL